MRQSDEHSSQCPQWHSVVPKSGLPCAEDSLEADIEERRGKLLQTLSDLTQFPLPGNQVLPPDFKLQLQLLQCVVQQQMLLQQVADQQQRIGMQVNSILGQGVAYEGYMKQSLQHTQDLREMLQKKLELSKDRKDDIACTCPGEVICHSDISLDALQDRCKVTKGDIQNQASSLEKNVTWVADASEDTGAAIAIHRKLPMQASEDTGAAVISLNHSSSMEVGFDNDLDWPEGERNFFARCIGTACFDGLCVVVIILNAATMGVSANDSIVTRLEMYGDPKAAGHTSSCLDTLGYCFTGFYTMEICLKLAAEGRMFFLGSMWQWNVFDALLVLIGITDTVLEKTVFSKSKGGSQLTILRLLRVLKMFKMLRVIRVMRFFQVLRTMVNSIAGSMMTLMWSILMLFMIMYVFGLCFLNGVSEYLEETSPSDINVTTIDGIRSYWSSVLQAMITLYFAVTGGADWEVLAQPLKEAGGFYYAIFLYYIAFTAIAVLNVLTGIYVDTATKISDLDEESRENDILLWPETSKFRAFWREKCGKFADDTGQPILQWNAVEEYWDDPANAKFFQALGLDQGGAKHVYETLVASQDGGIELGEFVVGCIHAFGKTQAMDIFVLVHEAKNHHSQLERLTEYVQDSFAEIHCLLGKRPLPELEQLDRR